MNVVHPAPQHNPCQALNVTDGSGYALHEGESVPLGQYEVILAPGRHADDLDRQPTRLPSLS